MSKSLAFLYSLTGFIPDTKARVISPCTNIVVNDARWSNPGH